MKPARTLILSCTALACLVVALVCSVAMAEPSPPDFDQVLLRQYDWILHCKMQVLDRYLNYDGSMAQGLVCITVTYKHAPHIVSQVSQPPLKYEQLWYQNGRCVGMKRFNPSPFRANEQGAVVFADNSLAIDQHSREAANAIAHVLVDVGQCRGIVGGAILPPSTIDKVCQDLVVANFRPMDQITNTGEKHLSLRLFCPPSSTSRVLFYESGAR